MRLRTIATSTAPAAVGPYSQAIEDDGLVYCSGQVGLVPETGEMIEGGIVEQTMQVFRNLHQVLVAGGSGLGNVIRTTVYLADIADFEEMNKVYARAFQNHRPARTTIQAGALPKGALVEIDAVAVTETTLGRR